MTTNEQAKAQVVVSDIHPWSEPGCRCDEGTPVPSGDTVQAPDEATLPGFLQMQDAIEGALRGAGHDLADMADVVYVATEAVRALLSTDTTPEADQ